MMNFHIGTSGFYYDDWKKIFYPEDLKKKDWLSYYAEHFKTVEINNTFYNIPKKTSFEKWYADTPPDFKFTLKGNRYTTHIKKMHDVKDSMKTFYDAITPLAEKTSCVLWQLPSSVHFDKDKLIAFGEACSNGYINVLEFRHASWFTEECLNILRKYHIAYCMISTPIDLPEWALQTTDTAYLRFHGKDPKNWYKYDYSDKEFAKLGR